VTIKLFSNFQANIAEIYLPDLKVQRSSLQRSLVQHSWHVIFSCLFDSKSLSTKLEPSEVCTSTHNCKYDCTTM